MMRLVKRLHVSGSRSKAQPALKDFLQPFTVGILAQLNTVMTTSRGKSARFRKKQVLCSLGKLVSTIGPSITNIAPQVINFAK